MSRNRCEHPHHCYNQALCECHAQSDTPLSAAGMGGFQGSMDHGSLSEVLAARASAA